MASVLFPVLTSFLEKCLTLRGVFGTREQRGEQGASVLRAWGPRLLLAAWRGTISERLWHMQEQRCLWPLDQSPLRGSHTHA